MLPPANPDTSLATNNTTYEPAKAKSTYPAALITIVVSRIGRRPTRSESRPSTAVARNCMPE